jgi:hypothetical protein
MLRLIRVGRPLTPSDSASERRSSSKHAQALYLGQAYSTWVVSAWTEYAIGNQYPRVANVRAISAHHTQ